MKPGTPPALMPSRLKPLPGPANEQECMSYGMIGYVVPHSIYPKGYQCNPKLPLRNAAIHSFDESPRFFD